MTDDQPVQGEHKRNECSICDVLRKFAPEAALGEDG